MAVKNITREELQQKLDRNGVVLVEALSQQDYAEAHLPGALNLPQDEIDERAPELLPDKDAEVVVYCANTACPASLQVAERLDALGYTNVADYQAGKADWQEADLPTESSAPALT